MNKRDFLNEMIIEDTITMGDRWHNEDIEMFMDGVKQTPLSRKVQDFIVKVSGGKMNCPKTRSRWIHLAFSKGDLKILRTLCRAKSKATVEKRQNAFLKLQFKSHYGALFNKHKIENFVDMVM